MRLSSVLRLIVCGFAFWSAFGADKQGNLDGFDQFMSKALEEFKVPGAAVAVVKDGKIILAKGYGYRDVQPRPHEDRQRLVDESAAIGELVTERQDQRWIHVPVREQPALVTQSLTDGADRRHRDPEQQH